MKLPLLVLVVFICVLAIILLKFVRFLSKRRSIRNKAGHVAGWGDCPNCGDSWSWKESESIYYKPDRGVLICKECLRRPDRLDVDRICRDLREYSWPEDEIALVRVAVTAYKAKPAQ